MLRFASEWSDSMTKGLKIKSNSGVALAMVLVVTVLLSLIALAAAGLSTQNLRMVKKNMFDKQAVYVAEAGLNRAIKQVMTDSNWYGTNPKYENTRMPISDGIYTVWVCNHFHNTSQPVPLKIQEVGITSIPEGTCYILAEGKVGASSAKTGAIIRITKEVIEEYEESSSGGDGTFPFSVYSKNGVLMQASHVDGSMCVESGYFTCQAATFDTAILGSSVSSTVQAGTYSSIEKMTEPVDYPDIKVPTGLNPQSGFTLMTGSKVLEPGNYGGNVTVMSGNITLKGNNPGGVTEYVFKDITVQAGKNTC
jgi:Tfp pilus assembly protein PilX